MFQNADPGFSRQAEGEPDRVPRVQGMKIDAIDHIKAISVTSQEGKREQAT
ncbi:hypothetical protein E2C01_083843 [Portunus trituberculatus]|uniref:Uncharacterized protein n=1 Tax=Portunus trituberculatus TaxID=210409 RepID=A0A5B7J2Q0_PORTR|nr:hypothetical protein [Portunus trituberculatus]